MADANRIAAALRYQQDQAMPSPLAAAIQSPEYIGGALRDPQFYGDIGRRLSGLLKGGLQDILPTGAGPIMAKQGYEADPNYMQKMNDVGLAGMTVFHGSPYKFDKFDMSKIGTGEGAQAYGHGLYFAENPQVAAEYRKTLAPSYERMVNGVPYDSSLPAHKAAHYADIFQGKKSPQEIANILMTEGGTPTDMAAAKMVLSGDVGKVTKPQAGATYRVDLPDEHIAKMLDWDKPFSQQPKALRDALAKIDKDTYHPKGSDYDANELGQQTYGRLVRTYGDSKVSAMLNGMGIPGIRYLDAGSRTGKAGTSNFVVFDDTLPKIIGRE
jgi:hypothetical protein